MIAHCSSLFVAGRRFSSLFDLFPVFPSFFGEKIAFSSLFAYAIVMLLAGKVNDCLNTKVQH